MLPMTSAVAIQSPRPRRLGASAAKSFIDIVASKPDGPIPARALLTGESARCRAVTMAARALPGGYEGVSAPLRGFGLGLGGPWTGDPTPVRSR